MTNLVGLSPLQEASDPPSDDHLVSRLRVLCRSSKETEIEIIRLLVILQARHLELPWTFSSLYKFCAERLGMTQGEATRRVAAARLVRKVPALLEYLQAGKLTMTTLLCLRDYVNEANAKELLPSVASKSKREVELVLAHRRPNPGVRSKRRRTVNVEPGKDDWTKPLSEGLPYRLEIAQSSGLHEKIELARSLMANRGMSDGLVVVIEAAMDALLADLRARDGQLDGAGVESVDGRVPARVTPPTVERDASRAEPCVSSPESPRSAPLRPPVKASRTSPAADRTTATPSVRGGRDSRAKGAPTFISEALRQSLKQRPGPRTRDLQVSATRKPAAAGRRDHARG